MTDYDPVAQSYDLSLQPIPHEYIRLIHIRFGLQQDDKIIDLGCGSGLLTFPLSKVSSFVEGIDLSEEMLSLAHDRDYENKIKWSHSNVEAYKFVDNCCRLIIGFESFHEFLSEKFILKCGLSLLPGGYLAIGWVVYPWELVLKNLIVEIFSSRGISWGDWDYYTCPNFPSIIQKNSHVFSAVVHESITIRRRIHVKQIARFLTSIDKVAKVTSEQRKHLAQELEDRFKEFLSSEWVTGDSVYALSYCQKTKKE